MVITIAHLTNLLENNEITYELLYAILALGTLLVSKDGTTGALCAYELKSYEKEPVGYYALRCESLDAVDVPQSDNTDDPAPPRTRGPARFGRIQYHLSVRRFVGVVKIDTLHAYPMKYHNDEAGLRNALLARARKWIDLHGMHHMQYTGIATMRGARYKVCAMLELLAVDLIFQVCQIDCGVMVDRGSHIMMNLAGILIRS